MLAHILFIIVCHPHHHLKNNFDHHDYNDQNDNHDDNDNDGTGLLVIIARHGGLQVASLAVTPTVF